jgi:hypothetical protein
MAFFGNGAVNRVNIHTGIVAFAHNAGGIFFMAVLLRQASRCRWRSSRRPRSLPVASSYGR